MKHLFIAALLGMLCSAPVMAASELEAQFAKALNDYRASKGRAALSASPKLMRAAQSHATDMARHGYFSHKGRDGSSSNVRIKRQGCSGRTAENIAGGYSSPSALMRGWMGSKQHKSNMLRSDVHHFGIARAGDIWVLVLAGKC
ncbi:CAP domain-containing protein [Vannielia sp.]|uniref:CAP domain-containing protein n=1 Tax=Vannielia sp. TaxID=2813045 RepID=UPI00261F95E2|nr:CAP domain-containing protein [Vannielia sp.]MDF1872418.1 CAP domain-containing protein [Vannielia sp.]